MSSLAPPEPLKAIKPYITLATQLDAKNEKVIGYYCRLFAIESGMKINKSDPECKKFLFTLMDYLENSKKEIQSDESIQSQIVGQACVERYALKIFENADEEDRRANFTKNLVKQFYSAGLLFDVLNYFGELSEDLVVKKQYAKRKAMYLNKCFQSGETPIAGPLTGELDGGDDFGGAAAPGHAGGFSDNQPPSTSPTKPAPISFHSSPGNSNTNSQYSQQYSDNANTSGYRPPSVNYSNSNTVNEDSKTSYSTVNPEIVLEAQKLCKHASSALAYDDVPTAINKLEACLKLLKGGR